MHTIIKTLPQLQQTQSDAWVYGLIVAGVALILAITIAFLINWRSDRRDYITRRIAFIFIGFALPASYWLYNIKMVMPKIVNPGFQNMFVTTNLYIFISAVCIYFVIGILLMFCFRTSKLGSILGKKKD